MLRLCRQHLRVAIHRHRCYNVPAFSGQTPEELGTWESGGNSYCPEERYNIHIVVIVYGITHDPLQIDV